MVKVLVWGILFNSSNSSISILISQKSPHIAKKKLPSNVLWTTYLCCSAEDIELDFILKMLN